VYVTEQADVLPLVLASAQVRGGPALKVLPPAAVKPPLVLGLTAQLTEPVGDVFVPFASMSVTVAVQVVPLPMVTVVAAQVTFVPVERLLTVTVYAGLLLLALCVESPP
jgi:hypothetical protein